MKRWRRWKARQRSALRLAVIPDGTRIAAHGLHPCRALAYVEEPRPL